MGKKKSKLLSGCLEKCCFAGLCLSLPCLAQPCLPLSPCHPFQSRLRITPCPTARGAWRVQPGLAGSGAAGRGAACPAISSSPGAGGAVYRAGGAPRRSLPSSHVSSGPMLLLPIFHKQNENQIKRPISACRVTAGRLRSAGRAESGAALLAGWHSPLYDHSPSLRVLKVLLPLVPC